MTRCRFDIMRLFSRGRGVLMMIAAPALLILAFALAIGPLFFAGDVPPFSVALLSADGDERTQAIVEGLISTEQSRALVSVVRVSSKEEGAAALGEGAAAFITIEEGFSENLYRGGSSAIYVEYAEDKPLQARLIDGVLSSAAGLVNGAQRSVNAAYDVLREQGQENAADVYYELSNGILADALMRQAVFNVETEASPLGEYLPVEYYALSLTVVFALLLGLPLTSLVSGDAPQLPRVYLSGGSAFSFCAQKLAAGGIYLFLATLPQLLLTAAALAFLGCSFEGIWQGAAALLLCSFLSAALSLFSASLMRRGEDAVKLSFMLSLLLIMAGGLIIPPAFFGELSGVPAYTPAGAAAGALGALLHYTREGFLLSMATVAGYMAVIFLISAALLRRRGGSLK